jgi:hypothetical protein
MPFRSGRLKPRNQTLSMGFSLGFSILVFYMPPIVIHGFIQALCCKCFYMPCLKSYYIAPKYSTLIILKNNQHFTNDQHFCFQSIAKQIIGG